MYPSPPHSWQYFRSRCEAILHAVHSMRLIIISPVGNSGLDKTHDLYERITDPKGLYAKSQLQLHIICISLVVK
jgi:hypothetical protein